MVGVLFDTAASTCAFDQYSMHTLKLHECPTHTTEYYTKYIPTEKEGDRGMEFCS